MMAQFLLAVQFLTVIPIKIKEINEQKVAFSVVFFPLVGFFLGLFLVGVNILLSYLGFIYLALNVILVVVLIIITGGMHLDGLSDTADAFFSGKPREEMLKIMRDSHVGVMGVLSLICAILLKVALLSSIGRPLRLNALVLMCVLSRWSVAPVMFLFPYARQEGKAEAFIKGMNLRILILSLIVVIVCAFIIWDIKGIVTLLIATAFAYAIGKFAQRKIGGITGDTLGATIELTELVVLLIVCIAQGVICG